MKRSTLKLLLVAIVFLLFSGNLCAQSNVYLRSFGEPWGVNSNIESLNNAFGEGNWQDLRYETVDVNSLFNGVNYIFLEGSDSHANALESFLTNNLPAIEKWVQVGGLLFINAGPNQGDGMDLGFGGVSLIYPNFTTTGIAVDADNPIFNGPFLPVGNTWSNSFGHATVTGPGVIPLIVDATDDSKFVLAKKQWGRGLVLFGGMPMTYFHSPTLEASNLRSNILSLKLVNGSNDAGVASLQSPNNFCSGTHPIEVVVQNFGINIIGTITVNWEFDGIVQPPVQWTAAIDTIGGERSSEALVSLGSKNFEQGVSHNLRAWTSGPNSIADTISVNDTLIVVLQPSLEGTFTIGGANPDYASFSDAVAALEANGLCGPVIFNVRSGTYNEQVTVPLFRGSSSTNTVTFQSESADRNSVIITHNAQQYEQNFTLRFDGARHVRFQYMTLVASGSSYGRVVEFFSGATFNEVSNSLIQGRETSSSSDYRALVFSAYGSSAVGISHNNIVRNNVLNGGDYGIYYIGYGTEPNQRGSGIRIEGNSFQNQSYHSIHLYGQAFPKVIGNIITNQSNIESQYVGIYAESCFDSLQFIGNKIDLTNGGVGIYHYNNYGSETNRGLIANNFVLVSGAGNDVGGIYNYSSSYQNYYHNSVLINSPNSNSTALNILYSNNIKIYNNILANNGGGLGARYSNDVAGSTISADYNNLFSTGKKVINYDGTQYTLGGWQQLTGEDRSSLSVNPVFTSVTDLHAQKALLDGAGTPVGIVSDIDGELRSLSVPDIGADEFVASGSDASLIYIDYPRPPFTSGNFDIKVVLQNSGAATLTTATINLRIDAVLQTPFHWTGSLVKGETDTLNLGSFLFNSLATYDLTAWSENPNGLVDIDVADDTVSVENVAAGLPAGTYTIGGIAPDFVDFSSATNVISYGGILGPVMFNVRNGTYNENITILEVGGASPINTITFQSESGDSSSVVLTHGSTDNEHNFTVKLDGADYITFKNLTIEATDLNYGHAIYLLGDASNNEFINNIVRGVTPEDNTSTDLSVIFYSSENSDNGSSDRNSNNKFFGRDDNTNAFNQNLIQGGSYGVYNYGETGTRIILSENVFENQSYQAIALTYQQSPEISNNIIYTNTQRTDFFGIRLDYCGLNTHILNNKITIPHGGYGIYLNGNAGAEGSEGVIANNFIAIGGTSTAFGIHNQHSAYQNIQHNSINVYSSSSNAYAYFSNGGDQHDIRNNIFNNSGAGYAIYIGSSSAIAVLDYNDVHAVGTLGAWNGKNFSDLNAWKAGTGRDQNSVSVNPLFISLSDLHVNKALLNNTGTPIASITTDIDGEPRSTITPDIGADEFEPVGLDVSLIYLEPAKIKFAAGINPVRIVIQNSGSIALTSVEVNWLVNDVPQTNFSWTGNLATGATDTLTIGNFNFSFGVAYKIATTLVSPNEFTDIDPTDNTVTANNIYAALGGIYTIGGSTPDFPNFTQAIQALTVGGVYTNTVFNVRPGTYPGQITLPELAGTGPRSQITFQSENEDSTSVILTFGSFNLNANYTVQLNGADYVTFRKMTLRATGGSYGHVLDIRNGASNNNFVNNRIQGFVTNSTSPNLAVIYSDGGSNGLNDNQNRVESNAITNGSYGIYYLGYSSGESYREFGTVIKNNTVAAAAYMGLFVGSQDSLKVMGNDIRSISNRYDYQALYLQYCHKGVEVSKNSIFCSNGGYGIYIYQCQATETIQNLIANNTIQIGGTVNEVAGLTLNYSDYTNIYHNTIKITNTISNSRALFIYGGTSVKVLNNIFMNTGGGYGVNIVFRELISVLDYNNYYISGANFGYWNNGNIANFSAWKSAHGFDSHSLNIDPRFISGTDLHVREIALNATATPLAEVTDDIDGEVRDALTPDIGADEFTPQSTDAAIVALRAPTAPFNAGTNNITIQLRNSGLDALTNVQINWELNGVLQSPFNWTGALNSRDSLEVVLGTRTFDAGVAYNVKVWTSLPNGVADGDPTNDILYISNLYAALTGTYSIGGTSPDFATFNEAVTALIRGGVVGSALFNVRAGTYNEQFSIPDIAGSSVQNTIVFQSENGDSTSVILSYSASYLKNYTVELAGADGITFKNLTVTTLNNSYGKVINIRDKSNNNRFEHNVLQGRNLNTTSTEHAVVISMGNNNNNTIINNNILYGAYGIFYRGGNSSENNDEREEGTIIHGNIIENQYYNGIRLEYQKSPEITNNTIRTNTNISYYYGMYLQYIENDAKIIANNISMINGGYGILCTQFNGNDTQLGLIANNFINISGQTTDESHGLSMRYGGYQNIYHNTIAMGGNNSNSYSLYLYSVNNCNIRNNIITNTAGGYAVYNNSATFTSDYNDLYTKGEYFANNNNIAVDFQRWKNLTGGDRHSFSIDPRFISLTDLHVREIVLNNAGQALPEITEDIDGNPRNSTNPDIGADEFTPGLADAGIYALINPKAPFKQGTQPIVVALKNHGLDTLKSVRIQWTVNNVPQSAIDWTGELTTGDTTFVTLGNFVFNPTIEYTVKSWSESPNNAIDTDPTNDTININNLYSALIGTYTIGGVSPDFPAFNDAVKALDNGGVAGAVTFNVRAGSYNEQISLPEIAGTSSSKNVVFQTESGADDVSLIFDANSTRNYTLQLDGASYFKFKNLSIGAGNTSYGTTVRIQNKSHHNTFESNTFNGVNTTSGTHELSVVYGAENSNETNITFKDNRFIGGSYGYYGSGQDGQITEAGTVLENNTFENQYYAGIWITFQNAPKMRMNVIKTTSNYTNFFGIRTYVSKRATEIFRNQIQITNGGYGIFLEFNEASSAGRGLIANNFISIGGTSTAQGLYSYYCTYQNIYHNSIHVTSTQLNNNSIAAYFQGGSNLDVKNNIFVNSGGSYAINVENVSNSFTSNYNNLRTTGQYLGYWSGDRTDLQEWSNFSAQDRNSVSVNPFFYSNTDLHVYNVSLNGAAAKINTITEDFDGNPRTAKPDIGADEFIPPTEDASVLSLLAPSNPVNLGPNDVIVQLFNNATVNLNNVTINWSVNGITQPVFEWTGSLAPSTSDSVTVGSFMFQSGIAYEIMAWSSQPNGLTDLVPFNDSTTVSQIFVGMSGTYTIGGATADFPNFTQAVEALRVRHVAGPVTFLIANGIYNERITINQVLGASQDHPIIFESASGDSTKVTLTYATSYYENYTLGLLGADHITFRKMKILSTGYYDTRVIEIADGANYNTVESCVLQSTGYNYYYQPERGAIVYSNRGKDDFNVFRNNVFKDGAYGLFYYGLGNNVSDSEKGTVIENNLFEDQYYAGMWLSFQTAPKINNNNIVTFTDNVNFFAIYGSNLILDLEISRNKISSNYGGYGIRLDDAQGTPDLKGKIYNNFIYLGGTSTAYGSYLANCNYLDYSFNNVNISSTNTSASGTAFSLYFGSNTRVRNNIFVNTGGGYAYYNNAGSSVSVSDYNNLYTTGANLAFWQGNYSSLEALQITSGKDAKSLSVDPSYAGTSDLHVNQSNLDGAGTPIPGITSDIDGQLRHETTPDIGADEFGAGLTTNDIGVVALVGPANNCTLASAESILVRVQNFGIDTIADFSVSYILNDTITVTENVTGAELKGGKSLEYRFTTPTNLSAAGYYNFIFYTTLAGDSNVNNDTLYTSVIRHYPAVTAEVSANDTICQGSYAYLTADGGSSYAWKELGSDFVFRNGKNIYVTPSSDITYVVEVANEFGCSDKDTVSVFVLPAPERPLIEVVGSTSVCARDTVRLISSVKENIVWNTGAATSEIQVFDPGTYTVTHRDTLTGCTSARSVTLSYTPPPYIYAGTGSICQGGSITLSVIHGARYRWSTGETTQSITVSPSSNSTYTVDVINPDGCEYLGLSVNINVNPVLPTPQITSISTNTEICPGSPATLTVTGNAQQYIWSNGAYGATITVRPTVDTQYTVTATNGQCSQGSAQASVFVKVLPKPTAPIIVATGSSTLSFCDADSITLYSSDIADSLLWSTGASTRSITVFDPGVYSVRLINRYGCSNSASVTITDPPVPYIIGKSTVCEGESTTLAVNNGASYKWSTGSDKRSITVSPDTTTMYYVNITNEAGCKYRDSIRVTILPKPLITGISGDTTICLGAEVMLNVSGTAEQFIWSEGGSGTSINVHPTKTTIYTVTATNGCAGTNFNDFDKVKVTVLPLPAKPVITASGPTLICEGTSIRLTSNIAGTITWSTGDSTQSITVSKAGEYTLMNSNQYGCTQSEKVEIFNPEKPQLIIGGFTTICRGDNVRLTYTNAKTFHWSTGETTESVVVSPTDTTTYTITATNELGCSYSNSVRINVIAPVAPDSVTNMVPGDDQSGLSLPLAFSWAPASNASHYDVYIWRDSLPPPDAPYIANLDQISQLIGSALNYGDTYNWQVVAKNSCYQTQGPVKQFTLRELPDLVVEKVEVPKSAFSGQTIDVAWHIANKGLGDTDPRKTWIETFYLSVDNTLEPGVDIYLGGAVNLTALEAGQGYRNTASFKLPKGITGERYVFVSTDQYNTIAEVSNSNNSNRNLTPMLINLTPPPDLQVDVVQVPNNVFSGQTISVSWTVKNRGTGATETSVWKDRIFIAQDSILRGSSATKLAEFDHSGHLDPGQIYLQTQSVQVPEGIFGPFFIFVVTDANNNLFEHAFENNNTGRSNGMQVILAPPADLVVTSVTTPANASNKETIALSWEGQNQGGSPISGKSWVDRIYISDLPAFDSKKAIKLGDRAITAELSLGSSYAHSMSIKIPDELSGPCFIYVSTDADNQVFEYENDINNITKSNPINILSPDLIISQIVLPDTASSGKNIDVTWTVKNVGPGKLLNGRWEDAIAADNSAIYQADSVKEIGSLSYTGTLLPGETMVKTKTVTVPNGLQRTQFIHMQTDRKTQVFEASKETNNFSYKSLYVKLSPWADLKPEVISTSDTATAGLSMPVAYRVSNKGVVDAIAPWVDKIYVSTKPEFDPKIDTVAIAKINHPETLKVDSTYLVTDSVDLDPSLARGKYYFYLVADAGDAVYEHTEEANNVVRIGPVFIQEYPPIDFAVDTLVAVDSAFSGTPITIQWQVRNVGQAASLAGYWFDAAFLSSDSIFNQTGDLLIKDWPEYGPLEKGEAYPDEQEIILPDGIFGDKYLILVNDYAKKEKERFLVHDADYSNNYYAAPIHITLTPPSDLIVSKFTAPTEGLSGQPVTVTYTVTNQAVGATTIGGWTDKIYLSTDFKVNQNDYILKSYSRTGNLNAAGTYTVTTDVFLPIDVEGNYILIVKTDNNDVQYEHHAENNNTATSIIAITKPLPADLVVTTVNAPDSVTAGEPMVVQWTIRNTGVNPATGVMSDIVYFSADKTWDINDVVLGEYPSTINLPPLSEQTRSLTAPVNGVSLSDYYILVRTDVRNNIYEVNDNNNETAAIRQTNVVVRELKIHEPLATTLENKIIRYYRIEVPDSLQSETLLVTLDGDNADASNEIYIKYGQVPTRVSYDKAFSKPFFGDQEIVMPDLKKGTYYLLVYGESTVQSSQAISLQATILNFEIRHVTTNIGGNSGLVTVIVDGSKFTPDMTMILENSDTSFHAVSMNFIDPTKVFVTFDLKNVPVGRYDVVAEKKDKSFTTMYNGFEVQTGTGPVLETNLNYPPSTRPNNIVAITIQFANGGNVDVISPTRTIISLFGAPLSFNVSDLVYNFEDLNMQFNEPGAPAGVLRPGAISELTVYTKAIRRLRFKLMK